MGEGRAARLTSRSVAGHLVRLTLPMTWGLFAVIGFNLADTYFVACLGTQELAAMSFTFPVVLLVISLALGLGVGVSSAISRAIGEGGVERTRRLTTASLLLALFVSLLLMGLGLATLDLLFGTMGAGPEALALIRRYMGLWYLSIPLIVVPMVGNAVLRANGLAVLPSLIMTLSALLNVLLDPLFIFGLWGFPRLEMEGAALATILARAVTLITALALLHWCERLIVWRLPGPAILARDWGCLLHVGLPAAATQMVTPVAIGAVTALVASFGPAAVAGFGVGTRVEAFAMILTFALTAAIGPLIGQNYGAGRFGASLAAAFDPAPQVVATAELYLWVAPASFAGLGVMFTANAAVNALGRPSRAAALGLGRMLLFYLPLALAGALLFGLPGSSRRRRRPTSSPDWPPSG